MLNLITQKKLQFDSMIEELRGLSNVFYGTSDAARKFYKLFNESEVNIDSVVISSDYYKENFNFFDYKVKDINVYLEELNESDQKVNIIVFFGIDNILLDRLKSHKNIEKIYLIDGGVCFLRNFEYEEIESKISEFSKTYEILEDQLSKDSMIGFIDSRISGYSEFIRKYTVPESYFPKELVKLEDDEILLDCGAFDGDTIEIFKNYMKTAGKEYKKIYGFEPDIDNYAKLKENNSADKNVIPLNIGVFNKKDTLSFCNDATGGSCVSNSGNTTIEVEKIDNLIPNDSEVTIIKMDLEGVELEALEGAQNTIKNYKPRLAIAVYHKVDDLIKIPKYIKSLVPEYKFYLRAQCYDSVDFTLYAIIK
jgi:FkbM family methyltransferase